MTDRESHKGRIILLGLDGATFDVIEELAGQGKLPGFSRLMREGSYGRLRSTTPPMTAPAWVSMTTGKNQGKHGIYDFWTAPWGNYERYIINSSTVQVPRIWDYLAGTDKTSIVFNVPVTYPPVPVRGLLVSGMLTPALEYEWTYPSELKDKILSRWPGYIIDSGWTDEDTADPVLYFSRTLKALETRQEILEHLLESCDWDFCMAVFIALDRVQHFLWRFHDSTHPYHEKDAQEVLRDAVVRVYRRADDIIQWLLSYMGKDDTLIIASDHGFGKLEYEVYVYRWLTDNGYTRFVDHVRSPAISKPSFLKKFLSNKLFGGGDSSVSGRKRRETLDKPVQIIGRHYIDWEHTKAFYGTDTDCGIYINLKGRFPAGTVNEGSEYDNLRHEIKSGLLELRTPRGAPVFENIYFREELYEGMYQELAPDIILQAMDNHCMIMESPEQCDLIVPARWRSGTHANEGIFLAHGPQIQHGNNLRKVSIYDIAPTIMHMFGMRIPIDMDGKVLENIFNVTTPVTYDDNTDRYSSGTSSVLTDSEQQKIRDRLKSLGYIS